MNKTKVSSIYCHEPEQQLHQFDLCHEPKKKLHQLDLCHEPKQQLYLVGQHSIKNNL